MTPKPLETWCSPLDRTEWRRTHFVVDASKTKGLGQAMIKAPAVTTALQKLTDPGVREVVEFSPKRFRLTVHLP